MTGTKPLNVGYNALPRSPDKLENVYISPDYLVKAYEYEDFVEMSRGDWERLKLLLKRPVLDLKGKTVHYDKDPQTITEIKLTDHPVEEFERGEGA